MTAMTERMSVGFAVFNQHISDAAAKARDLFIRTFGQETWDRELEPYARNGIMAIFEKDFTFYTGFYAIAVMLIVNGDVEVI